MYMSSLINFRRILLSPKGTDGGGGGRQAKKTASKGDDGGKSAPKGKAMKAVPKAEIDEDEDEIDDDDDTDELDTAESVDDDTDDDLEEADEDEDEEEEDDEKRTHRSKIKDKGKEKGVKPKLVSISDKELRELKRKAGEAEIAISMWVAPSTRGSMRRWSMPRPSAKSGSAPRR
jgi:hypothetical protein